MKVATLTRRTDRLPPVAVCWNTSREWAYFALALGLLAATVWGKMRTNAPLTLAIVTVVLARFGGLPSHQFLRRFLVLVVTFVVAYSVRNLATGVVAHRGSRFLLGTGMFLAVLLAVPESLRVSLRRIAAVWQTQPHSRSAYRFAFALVALPAFLFFQTTTRHVWTYDTVPVVPSVVVQYHTGSRELSRFLPGAGYRRWDVYESPQLYFVREVPGRTGIYSSYPVGMELFTWPVVIVFDLLGFSLFDDDVHLSIEKVTASLVASLSLMLFFLIALRFGSPAAAAFVTLMLATGSVFTSTFGMLLWQQGGVVFWMLVVLLTELQTEGRPRGKAQLLQAFACAAMLLCRPSSVTFLVPFGLWVFARDPRRGVILPLLSLMWYSPWAVLYWTIYRDPFGPSMGFLHDAWSFGTNLNGVLFSPGRGLFVYQPFLLLLAFLPVVRPIAPLRGWHGFALSMIGLHLFLVASWPCWWGGSCYGSRLLGEVVPLMALLVVPVVDELLKHRAGWLVAATFAWLGFAIHAPCVFQDAWLWNALPNLVDANPWRLWDWSHPPFLYGLVR